MRDTCCALRGVGVRVCAQRPSQRPSLRQVPRALADLRGATRCGTGAGGGAQIPALPCGEARSALRYQALQRAAHRGLPGGWNAVTWYHICQCEGLKYLHSTATRRSLPRIATSSPATCCL
ncbi:unnamed protein product [Closterium sp. NIES-64]|nr:unnamed protein product [Closterium sp. NIES-64]CAI6006231.1 unnamed protein product [Closterium sp. NIES-64]